MRQRQLPPVSALQPGPTLGPQVHALQNDWLVQNPSPLASIIHASVRGDFDLIPLGSSNIRPSSSSSRSILPTNMSAKEKFKKQVELLNVSTPYRGENVVAMHEHQKKVEKEDREREKQMKQVAVLCKQLEKLG